MADVVYNWERYWVPRDGAISFDLEGFPIAPETDAARRWKTDSVGFEKLNTQPCLVFLGEPGIGKTYALRDAEKKARAARTGASFLVRNLGTYSTDTHLVHDVFESPEFNAWRVTGGELHVFLDSFDECLFRIDALVALIADQSERLPNVQNLFLRIASRTAEWRTPLEDALREKWGKESVGVYELVPLTREQILVAAEQQQLPDTKRFLQAVMESEVVPFATKPLTLDLLFRIWRKHGGSLPSTQEEIYEKGCLELCTDPLKRDTPKLRRQLSPAQRLAVASHTSAAMVFCRRAAVWTGPQQMPQSDTDVTPAELEEGSVVAKGQNIPITERALREALDTGIFTSRGRDRMGWAHQTFGEFLAARYLKRQGVSTRQMLDLLVHPHDPERKLVPQLQETAAWLAGTSPEILDLLMDTQADLLLRSDVAAMDSKQKAKLVDVLLSRFDGNSIQARDYWSIYRRYPKLRYAGLTKQLRRYIRNHHSPIEKRTEAVVMADACDLKELLPDLVQIALAANEAQELRHWSARAVARLGDTELKARLKPLALGTVGPDPSYQLKGVGLDACWPDALSAEELFASLQGLDAQSDGAYHTFLREKVTARLSLNDIPIALTWTEKQPEQHGAHFGMFEGLTYRILEEASKYISDDDIRRIFARVLLSRLRKHEYCHDDEAHGLNEVFQKNKDLRLKTVMAMAAIFEDTDKDAVLMCRWGLRMVSPQDLPWLLEQLRLATSPVLQENLSHLIAYVFYPDNSGQVESVIETAQGCPILAVVLRQWCGSVDLDSEQAKKGREEVLQQRTWREEADRRQRPTPLVPPPAERIVSLLDRFDSGDLDAWWQALYWMQLEDNGQNSGKYYRIDIRELPGWQKASEPTRQRLLKAAHRYVQQRQANPDECFPTENVEYRYATAAIRALLLLANEARSDFDQLSPEVWLRWIPAILRCLFVDEMHECRLLVTKSFEKAPRETTTWTIKAIDFQNSSDSHLRILQQLPTVWTPNLGAALLARLKHGGLKPVCTSQLLTAVIEHNASGAIQYARSLIPARAPRDEHRRFMALDAARLLMRYGERGDWLRIQRLIDKSPSFGRGLIEGLTNGYDFGGAPILGMLSQNDVARLYEWMTYQYFPKNASRHQSNRTLAPAHRIEFLYTSLVSLLVDNSSQDGCNTLRRLTRRFPNDPLLRRALHQAREQMRRQTWRPPTVSQLFELAASRKGRLVQSDGQLFEVTLESISRFQTKLQGKRPLARLLWAGDRPKPEGDLSDWLEDQLSDLTSRGIVIGREVKVHHLSRLDLRIDAVAKGPGHENYSTVQVIIEVKGCWHRELKTAMKTQLLDSYLAKNDCRHGIYLVGWFLCEAWTGKNPTRTAVKFPTIERLNQFLQKQARSLSSGEKQLHAVVLDARIELTKRRKAVSSKLASRQKRTPRKSKQ